jgi:hypothetical protein
MKRLSKFLGLTTIVLLLMTHRCPAPIEEIQQAPTPAPTVAAIPQRPPVTAPTPAVSTGATGAARFAGTWMGKINMQKLGEVGVTLVVNADGTSVQMKSKMNNAGRPLTYNGKVLSWQGGAQNNIPWTLTLNPDGQTAVATRAFAGTTTTATFKRVAEGINNTVPSLPDKKGKRP